MRAEIEGAADACGICREPEKKICYVLKTLKDLGIYFKGKCGRDTKTGVLFTRGDANEKVLHGENQSERRQET